MQLAKDLKEKKSSLELHRLKKQIEELEKKKGRGTELISLYIPPDKNIVDVINYLRQEYSQAANIKSARTRKNVQTAIESILQRLKYFNKPPENGLVVFAGTITYNNKEKFEIYLIEPPEKLNTSLYRCDSTFYLEPLKEMLEYKGTYGLLTVDRNEATIALLKGKRIEIVKHMESNVPRKHGRGGQSQRRFEKLIEQAAHEYFKRVGQKASETFLSVPDLKGVIIGGPGPTKEFFVQEGYLKQEVQQKILDIIDTSYTDEFGIKELVEKASKVFEDLEITKEKNLVQKFLKEVVKDGLAAYGEKEVREMLEIGAVDTVLISEDVESFRVKIKCDNCGYEEEKTVKNVDVLERELQNKPCPKCKEKSLDIVEKKSTIEEFAELAESTGAKVEVISSDTEEGQQLKAFGGIAAILRFKPK